MKIATGNALLRAYGMAVRRLDEDPKTISSAVDAGFIVPEGTDEGIQVFVHVYRWSRTLMKSEPLTGGLLVNRRNTKQK